MKKIVNVFVLIFLFQLFNVIAQDLIEYSKSVQNKHGFIRYPLGTIGAWSTEMGEIGSIMTRTPRIYPCLDSVVIRHLSDNWRFVEEDWRDTIYGDPSLLVVKYNKQKPSSSSMIKMTVTPHVSVFKLSFPNVNKEKYIVFDFARPKVDPWAKLNKWNERVITLIDNKTILARVNEPAQKGAFYVIKLDKPCVNYGILDHSTNLIKEGINEVKGSEVGMYAKFNEDEITIAVAESFESFDKAKEFINSEFVDFETAHNNCKIAWNQFLSNIEIEGSELSKSMAYTALYTLYANIINGNPGSVYSQYYPNPKSLSSSDYWQFIGGFHSCAWDNYRTSYPFLMLTNPDIMKDVINTYLARYQRDGVMGGNIDLFTGPMEGNNNPRVTPVVIAQAYYHDILADYVKLYNALKDNFSNENYFPKSILQLGYMTQPSTGGMAVSRTLEYSTSLHSLALLAKANKDLDNMKKYFKLSKSYVNVWDSTTLLFRVRNEDGSWGPISHKEWTWNPNPYGLFEGTSDDWMFAVPHDPYGLINLPGQKNFVERVINYCLNDTWFNDYQYIYPYLLYYAGVANEAQRIIRKVWVPLFKDCVMHEEATPKPPYKTYNDHYTSNAGWLISSMIGLFPMNAPTGQYILTSPSITKAVIHRGDRVITVQTKNNSEENIYISSIKVDGKIYPCYMIPAKRLVKGVNIELEMTNDSTKRLGNLYVSSTDGYVENAELVSPNHLRFTIDAVVEQATTKIYSLTKPNKIMVNGNVFNSWKYDKINKIVTITSKYKSVIDVFQK